MAEQPTRSRRIIRRAVMAVVGVVLLVAWYIGAWLVVSRAERDALISSANVQRVRPAFVPLLSYCESKLPGSGVLERIWWRLNSQIIVVGSGTPVMPSGSSIAIDITSETVVQDGKFSVQDRVVYITYTSWLAPPQPVESD